MTTDSDGRSSSAVIAEAELLAAPAVEVSRARRSSEMAERKSYNGLMHAGAGTGLFLVQLSALIPGLLPSLALLGVIAAVVVLPLVALTLVAGVLAAPPVGVW